jgi:hypothetical protein
MRRPAPAGGTAAGTVSRESAPPARRATGWPVGMPQLPARRGAVPPRPPRGGGRSPRTAVSILCAIAVLWPFALAVLTPVVLRRHVVWSLRALLSAFAAASMVVGVMWPSPADDPAGDLCALLTGNYTAGAPLPANDDSGAPARLRSDAGAWVAARPGECSGALVFGMLYLIPFSDVARSRLRRGDQPPSRGSRASSSRGEARPARIQKPAHVDARPRAGRTIDREGDRHGDWTGSAHRAGIPAAGLPRRDHRGARAAARVGHGPSDRVAGARIPTSMRAPRCSRPRRRWRLPALRFDHRLVPPRDPP